MTSGGAGGKAAKNLSRTERTRQQAAIDAALAEKAALQADRCAQAAQAAQAAGLLGAGVPVYGERIMKGFWIAALWLLVATATSAAPYTLIFTSTVITDNSLPTGITVGDSFEMYVVVDNGGATAVNQTWTYADVQSVAFALSGGSYVATFPSSTFVSPSTGGTIQTDGTGAVSSSTTSWRASSTAGNFDSIGLELSEWYINGANDIIF